MDNDLHVHYEAVLNAERSERDRMNAEIKRLQAQVRLKDGFIAAIAAKLSAESTTAHELTKPLPFTPPLGLGVAPHPTMPDNLRYASISVRWGLLSLMCDYTTEPMATADMAEALKAGGVRSGGANFAANVSAVVSDMVKNRGELELIDGKYRITPRGREVWAGIKAGRQFKRRYWGVSPAGDVD